MNKMSTRAKRYRTQVTFRKKARQSYAKNTKQKKLGLLFWCVSAILAACFLTTLTCGIIYLGHIYGNYINGDYDSKSVLYTSAEYSTYSENPISQKAVNKFETCINKIDPKVFEAFVNDGGTIIISSSDLTQEKKNTKFLSNQYVENGNDQTTVGYITYKYHNTTDNYEDLQIVLSDNLATMEKTLNHEFGHYIDLKLGYPSTNSDKFDALFRNHFECFDLDYYFDTKNEFFAELYSMYSTNPEQLLNKCEAAYIYMRLIDEDFRKAVFDEH